MADVFISYSRANREFAEQLRANLEAIGFAVWRDVHQMQVGDDWWRQITEAIEGSHTMILCMSPGALASPVVAQEWQYARQVGTRVMPIFAEDIDFATVPRWMSRVDWADFREGAKERDAVWGRFIDQLRRDYDRRRVPFMADKLPEYFVPRPEEFDSVLNALVNADGAVAITAAVKGAGGYGKTTLAMALCHDVRVRGAFDDGILWVTLGEKPSEADLIRKASDLITLLTGEAPKVITREGIKAALTEAVGDRYILLVIDDLWRKHDADIFLTGGKNSAVLITTRYEAQLPDSARFRQNVDAMRLAQAVQLLAWNLPSPQTPLPKGEGLFEAHKGALESLAKRLGEWAVLLRLVNGTLRQRMERGEALAKAIEYADKALTRKGLSAFDPTNPQERADAVRATLDVSIDLLTESQQAQFARLAVFPEDADIPFGTLEKLWGLDDFDTEEVVTALNNASLLLNFALDARVIRLHDVVRRYLIGMHRADLPVWQAAFVNALGDPRALSNEYEWRNIAYHLMEAGQVEALRGLLLDYRFLQAKLDATDVNALIADCGHLVDDEAIRLIQSALSMSAHVLNEDKSQWGSQLVGRLMTWRRKESEILKLTDAIMDNVPGLYPTFPDGDYPPLLQAGGPLIRTLVWHEESVNHVALSGDFAVSASSDGTLRVWNWKLGEVLHILEGHTDKVTHLALSGDFAVSAAGGFRPKDNTLRVWNWRTGDALYVLEGHTNSVTQIVLSGDFAISAAEDGTLRVWNWRTGEALHVFQENTDRMTRIASSGEYIVSALSNNTLQVWNWESDEVIHFLEGHTDWVNHLALSDEYAVSASQDGTLRVWNWRTGEALHVLEGHTSSVEHVALSDEYAVSASQDKTLRVWNWRTGEALHVLEGHTDIVYYVALADDYAVSASQDKTLRVWNWKAGEALYALEGHTDIVYYVALSDDYAVSVSQDKTLRVWRWQGSDAPSFQSDGASFFQSGHTLSVQQVVLSDEYAVSASQDATLRVWNWRTGKLLHILEGHTSFVNHVALSGEYAVSASVDDTLRVWNWRTGELLHILEGHTNSVNHVALSDDYAVSASSDWTLKVWNWKTGEAIHVLEGHMSEVEHVALSGDFAVSTAGGHNSKDHTLRVWNWKTGVSTHILEGHTDRVWYMALSGDFAISGSADKTLRVWNWRTGKAMGVYADTMEGIQTLAANQPAFTLASLMQSHPSAWKVIADEQRIELFNPQDEKVATFTAEAGVHHAHIVDAGTVMAFDRTGRVLFLRYRVGST